jgi:N-acetylmuramoyl-L-alanine amidase
MIKGIEIYSETNMTGGETLVKKSQLLATTFKSSLAALTGISLRAVKQKPLAVLRENRSPAILIELGYLSHPVDLDFLKDGNNDQQLAEAFFKALNAFQKHMQKY